MGPTLRFSVSGFGFAIYCESWNPHSFVVCVEARGLARSRSKISFCFNASPLSFFAKRGVVLVKVSTNRFCPQNRKVDNLLFNVGSRLGFGCGGGGSKPQPVKQLANIEQQHVNLMICLFLKSIDFFLTTLVEAIK